MLQPSSQAFIKHKKAKNSSGAVSTINAAADREFDVILPRPETITPPKKTCPIELKNALERPLDPHQ
jgi:hypothetical protein